MAEAATHRTLTASGVSSWFYARAFAWMRAHPGAALALFARKLAYTVHQTDLALNFSYDFFSLYWLPENGPVLTRLKAAGLGSLPGGGGEILRVAGRGSMCRPAAQ